MILYGLECPNPSCVHPTLRCYRLHHRVRFVERQPWMMRPEFVRADGGVVPARDLWPEIQGAYIGLPECPPRTFLPHHTEAMLNYIADLGGESKVGPQIIPPDRARRLPVGADAWVLIALESSAPKIALYFRWKPDTGEQLTPDKVFQLIFSPGATQAERRCAPERRLTEDEFRHVTRRLDERHGSFTRDLVIKCQHCHRPLPLSALNMISLREVELGD